MAETSERPRPRAWRDRVLVALARLLTRAFFRDVEVEGRLPARGPVVLAASHLYGFVDPVVLIAHLGVLPRFLAKGTLWNVPVAGKLLDFARVIPVHRRVDGAAEGANDSMFSAAVEALRGGSVVALFPEGTTHDDPTMRPLRTGAARIALETAAAGVDDVVVVPVGITYEDKVRMRGRALISYGAPIPVAAGAEGDDDHPAVRALTDRLQGDLNGLTPHFDSTEEALALTIAATMSLSVEGGAPLLRDVTARARHLSRLDAVRRTALVDVVARYRMLLGFVGLDDADIVDRTPLRSLVRRIVVLAVLAVVLMPLAVAGLYANLVPAVLVVLAGLIVKAPVSKGTVRLLVAVVTFPIMWTVWAWQDSTAGPFGDLARSVTYPIDWLVGPERTDRRGALANVLAFVVAPLLGIAALALVERAWALAMALIRWRTLLDRRGQLADVRARRADVIDAATAALAARPAPLPDPGGAPRSAVSGVEPLPAPARPEVAPG